MDVEELRIWARKMGYQGRMDDLGLICNASTQHIWKQIIERVRPRREIEAVRNNIIVHKMRHQHVGTSIPPEIIDCPSVGFEMWQKNKELAKSNKQLKDTLHEANKELNQLEFAQNMLKSEIQHFEIKLKEENCKEYLYRIKNKQMQTELQTKHGQLRELNAMSSRTMSQASSEIIPDLRRSEDSLKSIEISEINDEMPPNAIVDEFYIKYSASDLNNLLQRQADDHQRQIQETIQGNITAHRDYTTRINFLRDDNLITLQMMQIENAIEAKQLEREANAIKEKCSDQMNAIIQKNGNVQHLINEHVASIKHKLTPEFYSKEIELLTDENNVKLEEDRKHYEEVQQSYKQLEEKYEAIEDKRKKIVKLQAGLDEQRVKARNLHESMRILVNRNSRTLEILRNGNFSKEINLYKLCCVNGAESSNVFPYTSTKNVKEVLCYVISAIEYPITIESNLLEFFRKKYARYMRLMQMPKLKREFQFSKCELMVEIDLCVNNSTLNQLQDISSETPICENYEQALEIWKELPFADCISPELLRDGCDYKHYKDTYMYYLSQLNIKS